MLPKYLIVFNHSVFDRFASSGHFALVTGCFALASDRFALASGCFALASGCFVSFDHFALASDLVSVELALGLHRRLNLIYLSCPESPAPVLIHTWNVHACG